MSSHLNFNLSKEAKYLWDKSIIGLALIDATGRYLETNNALCNILEYTETELAKRAFQDITHPEDVGDDVEMCKKIISGGLDWYPMTKRYITKSGRIIWVKLTVNAVLDDDDNFICFFSQVFPIDADKINRAAVTATKKTKNRSFTLATIGEYLTNNWVWLSPIGAGMSYFAWKTFIFFYDVIFFYFQHKPHQ